MVSLNLQGGTNEVTSYDPPPDRWSPEAEGGRLTFVGFLRLAARKYGRRLPRPDQIEGEVRARVDHGRWIVDCDGERCAEAVVVSKTERAFCCPLCGSGGAWRRVVFPRSMTSIERELLKRPEPWQRGWNPGESVADLRRQNREHGWVKRGTVNGGTDDLDGC